MSKPINQKFDFVLGERLGNLVFVLNDVSKMADIKLHLFAILRGLYCIPPDHGSRIVSLILNDTVLREQW